MPSGANVALGLLLLAIAAVAVAACIGAYLSTPASRVSLSPEVLAQKNVQLGIERLSKPASSIMPGLLLPAEKQLIGATQAINSGATVYTAVSNAAVSILTGGGSGSGFIVDVRSDGSATVVTGAHVVLQGGGSTPGAPLESSVFAATPLGLFQLSFVGIDRAADVAVYSIAANARMNVTNTPPFTFAGGSAAATTGDDVWVLGDPLGIDIGSIAGGTVRDGKYVPGDFAGSIESVYCSAPILPGNSGGPFVNRSGEVVGLANWVVSLGDTPKPSFSGGVNAYMASRIVDQLVLGTLNRSYIGVLRYDLLAGRQAYRLLLQNQGTFDASLAAGVVILELDPTGPLATQTSLQVDDVIVEVAGVAIGPYEAQYAPTRVTWFHPSGQPLEIRYVRPSSGSQTPVAVTFNTAAFPQAQDVPTTPAF